jgi:hypothetical protein
MKTKCEAFLIFCHNALIGDWLLIIHHLLQLSVKVKYHDGIIVSLNSLVID